MSTKLRFTVASCSGEDPDYPVRELLFHSPESKGWQTERFARFPQEIVFRLERPSKIHEIQLLSHEYKIATKVEIFIGIPPLGDHNPDNCTYSRLGYLSFESNDRGPHPHAGRELKSVKLPHTKAYLLRLVVHRCHTNKLNIYNQVGILALNIKGEPLVPEDEAFGYVDTAYSQHQAHRDVPGRHIHDAGADIALDLAVDPVTAAKIRQLLRDKEAAVQREDYDEAKRLKAATDALKVLGEKVAQLEAKKRIAVAEEDYDLAKALKADIEQLRSAGDTTALGSIAAAAAGSDPHHVLSRVLSQKSKAGNHAGAAEAPLVYELSAAAAPYSMSDSPPIRQPSGHYSAGPASPVYREPLHSQPSGHTPYHAYEDRPAKARGTYDMEDAENTDQNRMPQPAAPSKPTEQPPAGGQDLPAPESLTGADVKDGEALMALVGEHTCRCMYSRNWQLRDAALQQIQQLVARKQLPDEGLKEALRTLARVLTRALGDRVPNVFQGGVQLLHSLVDQFSGPATNRDMQQVVVDVLPVLIDKTGDNNSRVKEAASECIVYLAGVKDASLSAHAHMFVRPVKNLSAYRPMVGRLQLLGLLLPSFGVSKDGPGFQLDSLMQFVGAALSSPNAEVRSTALKVLVQTHGVVGPAVHKHLPPDLNPKTKEQVDDALGDGEAAPAPAVAPAKPPPQQRAPPVQQSKPAPAPAAKQGTGVKSPKHHMPTHRPGAATAALDHSNGEEGGAVADDPAPYEAELKRREKALGPAHPDVAETLSNLAIIYNQRQDWRRAQPLYERALAIWEKAYGSEHSDVAHTLTDLAVLHLEQGHDDIGRPLLERALRIQEKALGPDHPDVVAIRDVLNSDDQDE